MQICTSGQVGLLVCLELGTTVGRVLTCYLSPQTSGVRAACTVRSLYQVHWQLKVSKIWLEPRVSGFPFPSSLALGSSLLLLAGDQLGPSLISRVQAGKSEHEGC